MLVILPLLYVLSFGPACRLVNEEFMSIETLGVIYSPLLWAGNKFQTFGDFLIWYAGLCGYRNASGA